MSNVCRAYCEVCEHATEYGYCRLTACAKHPQTITTNFTTSIIDTNNDVVEVVRCKNCIHNGSIDTDCPFGWKDKKFNMPSPNDYCSYGEKKDE